MANKKSTFQISVELLSKNFTKGISNIERQLKGLTSFAKGAFALGSVVAFGKQMIQVSSDFEDAMARVQAVSNASVQGFKMMTQEAKHLGETTRYTATEAAQALENLTRNGLTAQQATNSLASVLKLAQANAIGLAESANMLTNTMNMFGLTTKDTDRITDALSATAANSATNVTQLFEALTNAAPTAHNLGLKLEEVAAALGAMAQRGVKGAEAGTQLRMAMTKMVDPKIIRKMEEMGIAINEQQIREEGLLKTIERLKDANLELGDLVHIFSQRGAQGMAQLINAYNDFDILTKVLADDAGTTSRMFQQGLGSTKKAALMLKSAYQQLLISVGEETRGPFNALLRFLTDVVKNMYTWQGVLKNFAAVGIPLLTNAVAQFMLKYQLSMKQAVTATAKAAAKITALKTAIGGIVTTVITLASVIGVNLLMKLERTDKEINKLIEDLGGTEKETQKLTGRVQELIDKLDGGGNLNDVVLEACRLFPDFRDRILEAARAAGETNNYDNLKRVLQDILDLQAAVSANAVLSKLADSYVTKLSEEMQKTFGDPMASRFYKGIKDAVGKEGKGQIDAIYYAIADAIGRSSSLENATESVKKVLDRVGVKMDDALTEAVVRTYYMSDAADKAYDAFSRIGSNNDILEADEKKRAEAAAAAATAAEEEKDAAKKLEAIDENYNKAAENALDDLNQGYIKFEEYIDKLAKAAQKAYEDLRDATGAKGVENKYFNTRQEMNKRKENLEASNSIKEAQVKYNGVSGKADAMETLDVRVHPIVDIPELGMTLDEGLESFWKGFKTSTDAVNQFTDALSNLSSAYERLSDEDATWIERLQAAGNILEGTKKMVDAVGDAITLLGDKELAGIIKETLVGKMKRKEAAKNVAANTAEAGSGAAASVASIPYVGPFLAGAALASIVALIMATIPKFEKGGFIRGNTKYGDKLLARVNAGEAILNSRQQKNFMDMANGKYNGGGQVQFYISGKDLRGVLRNNDISNSRIKAGL